MDHEQAVKIFAPIWESMRTTEAPSEDLKQLIDVLRFNFPCPGNLDTFVWGRILTGAALVLLGLEGEQVGVGDRVSDV